MFLVPTRVGLQRQRLFGYGVVRTATKRYSCQTCAPFSFCAWNRQRRFSQANKREHDLDVAARLRDLHGWVSGTKMLPHRSLLRAISQTDNARLELFCDDPRCVRTACLACFICSGLRDTSRCVHAISDFRHALRRSTAPLTEHSSALLVFVAVSFISALHTHCTAQNNGRDRCVHTTHSLGFFCVRIDPISARADCSSPFPTRPRGVV